MSKDSFLNIIAQKAYDVGFGAKKNFASYDIINNLPSWVGFISLIIGIIQIAYENILFNKEISILLIFIGIAIIYLEVFKDKTKEFEDEGIRLTKLYNGLRDLYFQVKEDNNFIYSNYDILYQEILTNFYNHTISKQVFMADWYAHFKFFYEMQTEWIEKELKLKFFKDKLPNSFKTILSIILALIGLYLIYECLGNIPKFY